MPMRRPHAVATFSAIFASVVCTARSMTTPSGSVTICLPLCQHLWPPTALLMRAMCWALLLRRSNGGHTLLHRKITEKPIF